MKNISGITYGLLRGLLMSADFNGRYSEKKLLKILLSSRQVEDRLAYNFDANKSDAHPASAFSQKKFSLCQILIFHYERIFETFPNKFILLVITNLCRIFRLSGFRVFH